MARNHLRHILMSLGIPGTPPAIIVRLEPMPWRKGVLPSLKAIAADIVGQPVRWKDIHVHEALGNTPEEGEQEWLGFVERKTQRLYSVGADGLFERVN